MSYKIAFSRDFYFGFKVKDFRGKLIDKIYGNGISPSFYFKIQNQYFFLWVNYRENSLREDPETKKYILTLGVNLCYNEYLDIYDDHNKTEILIIDSIFKII